MISDGRPCAPQLQGLEAAGPVIDRWICFRGTKSMKGKRRTRLEAALLTAPEPLWKGQVDSSCLTTTAIAKAKTIGGTKYGTA
jgi:hypothetical protein